MKQQIDSKKVQEFFDTIAKLERLLDERIVDLHEVKGGMQSRHAYCYYRELLWTAKYIMRENLIDVKNEKNEKK